MCHIMVTIELHIVSIFFFFSSRRRHTRYIGDWSSDVCSSDLYSFLRGVASPEEIVAAAVEQNMPAVALTDTNGLYAAVSFYQAAKKAGVKPIVGVALDVGWSQDRREIPRFARTDGNKSSATLVLLATNMEGYSSLCQLVTLRHLGTTKLAQNAAAAEIDGR